MPIELYPFDQWKFVMNKIDQLNRFQQKKYRLYPSIYCWGKNGRYRHKWKIINPQRLNKTCSCIRKDIVLSAAVNILEIWDKNLYEEIIDEAKVDFSSLAEEVMGDDNE